jgi:pimeloyl-ACP methyl ester carboxylesterase
MDTQGAGRPEPFGTYVDDEFCLLHENAAEVGLPFDTAPTVRRRHVVLPDGRHLSALVWGTGPPEIVFLHGGGQNAHTWDTVLLALDRPAVAVDLPGHGHSSWRDDSTYLPSTMAGDVDVAMAHLAPDASFVVGMSLGGLTALALAGARPGRVRDLVLVDVTPGVDRAKTAAIAAFLAGPEDFASFDEILARTVAHNPGRSEASLRRGVLHNATRSADGRWSWRYDRQMATRAADGHTVDQLLAETADPGALWPATRGVTGRLLLVRGSRSPVVSDADVTELLGHRPDAEVVVIDGAGHSVQGDRPLALAALVARFADTPG